MKNILIIGATGQIGSELTMKLRSLYPEGNVVAGYIPGAEPKGALLESGPSHIVDITNPAQIAEAVDKYKVDTIYNLAALLSAVAEAKPQARLENRRRRTLQHTGSGSRERVCGIHAKFHRLIWTQHSPRKDPSGHCAASGDNLWSHQSIGRTIV